jgi:hypothetical protein
MAIYIDCGVCNQGLKVPNFAAGRITKCPGCGNAVRVPQPKAMLKEADAEGSPKDRLRNRPLAPNELWRHPVAGLSTWLDWLADRPARILIVALILVGLYVGVATAKWAFSRPTDAPIAASAAPVDPDPWDDATTSDANDVVRVTATSTATQQVSYVPRDYNTARKTTTAFFTVVLKIENIGNSPLRYAGWSVSEDKPEQAARLTDYTGAALQQVDLDGRVIGKTSSATIPPAGSIEDVLIFPNSRRVSPYLKLQLPAAACGSNGNLRIKLQQTPMVD